MDSLRPGDPVRVGSYRLTGRLGEGGMGRVYLGLSPGGRQVAVKVIHPAHASDQQFRERFAREIEAARRVGGFHTASVVDADPSADPPWMVTAYIHGRSLADTVRADGPLPADQICTLGAGLAEGLGAIHACGLVHRDLKPSNVILADDGPRIIDFGIAKAAGSSAMTTAGVVVGTYSYMSPEQVEGHVAGPDSDVFALGCTLAYAATGRSPFGDDSIAMVVHRIASEPPNLDGVSDAHGLRQLIGECLAKSPGDRPSLSAIVIRLGEYEAPAAAPASGNWWESIPTPPPQFPTPPPQYPTPPLYPGTPAQAGGGRRRRGVLMSPVDGQAADLCLVNRFAEVGAGGLDQRRRAGYRHFLANLPRGKRNIDASRLFDQNLVVACNHGSKIAGRYRYAILSRRQIGKCVKALRPRGCLVGDVRAFVGEGYLGIGNHGSGEILNRAQQSSGYCLSERRLRAKRKENQQPGGRVVHHPSILHVASKGSVRGQPVPNRLPHERRHQSAPFPFTNRGCSLVNRLLCNTAEHIGGIKRQLASYRGVTSS